jgi:hypothetical protein
VKSVQLIGMLSRTIGRPTIKGFKNSFPFGSNEKASVWVREILELLGKLFLDSSHVGDSHCQYGLRYHSH